MVRPFFLQLKRNCQEISCRPPGPRIGRKIELESKLDEASDVFDRPTNWCEFFDFSKMLDPRPTPVNRLAQCRPTKRGESVFLFDLKWGLENQFDPQTTGHPIFKRVDLLICCDYSISRQATGSRCDCFNFLSQSIVPVTLSMRRLERQVCV